VTKQLYVDASVPLEKRSMDFDFPLMVVLEHHEEQFSYAGPVGFIYYEHAITDFSYHTEYAIDIDERFRERMATLERTGTDPRSAIRGYTASTTPATPISVPPPEPIPMTPWSTVAPTVAHVAPMVHRIARDTPPEDTEQEATTRAQATLPRTPAPESMRPRTALPAQHDGLEVPTPTLRQPSTMAPAPQLQPNTTPVVSASTSPTIAPVASTPASVAVSWELVVEPRRLTTIIRCADHAQRPTEYRRVLHYSGAAYYFQDGRSISAHTYEQGTAHVREEVGAPKQRTTPLLQ
jgi:hypothetical protein